MDDADLQAPLAIEAGGVPAAPAWFTTAIAHEPERRFIVVQNVRIEILTWGKLGAPGLLFVHGHGAHADWWTFLAPFFATKYRVVAMSWSGMGRSGHRDRYSLDLLSEELFAAAHAGGLFDVGIKPVFIGHSLGGLWLIHAAAGLGDRLRGIICIDTILPQVRALKLKGKRPAREHKIYVSLTEALSRFRFSPMQPCANRYIADFIARNSLAEVHSTPASAVGWTWRFDPYFWNRLDTPDIVAPLQSIRCPIAMLWGERSGLMTEDMRRSILALAPPGTPMIGIPDAAHHVMVDQPIALVGALRGLLASWPDNSLEGAIA